MESIYKNEEEPFMIGIREIDNFKSRDILLNKRYPRVHARVIFGSIKDKGLFGKIKSTGYIEISFSNKMTDTGKYSLLHTGAMFKLSFNTDKTIKNLKREIVRAEVENESRKGTSTQKSQKESGVSEKELIELHKIVKILKNKDSEDEKMLRLIEATRYYIELIKENR